MQKLVAWWTIFSLAAQGRMKQNVLWLDTGNGTEILLILTRDDQTDAVLDAIVESGKLKNPGAGIAFVLDVNRLIGLQHRRSSKYQITSDAWQLQ